MRNYESINLKAVRPWLGSFLTDTPEFYRWYEFGGKARPEPLTSEQLTQLCGREQVEYESNAISECDWKCFKDQKLGTLREPIEILQKVVAQFATEDHWWNSVRSVADWCSTSERPVYHIVEKAIFDMLCYIDTHDVRDGGVEMYSDLVNALFLTRESLAKCSVSSGGMDFEMWYVDVLVQNT